MASLTCKMCAVSIFIVALTAASTAGQDSRVKEYNVNLDLPPHDRWTHVVLNYKRIVTDVNTVWSSLLPKPVIPIVKRIMASIDDYLPYPYAEEIRGISMAIDVPLGDMVLTNILYELTAYCTSIVAQDSKGTIWHGRNLDYNFTEILKNLTIIVNYQKAGKTLYTATTYAGFVGIVTGQRPHGFTISVDQRNSGGWWMNFLVAMLEKSSHFACFLVRDTLERASDFNGAVTMLSNRVTIASVYYIVGGVKPGEGVVITKGRLAALDILRLDSSMGRWYLVETNYDHWTRPPADDDRRTPAIRMMNATGQANINPKTLFKVLSTPPVRNSRTTYTTIMSAAQPGIHRVWVW